MPPHHQRGFTSCRVIPPHHLGKETEGSETEREMMMGEEDTEVALSGPHICSH